MTVQQPPQPDVQQLVTLGEASRATNVERQVIGRLMKQGLIQWYPDITDRRRKLISLPELKALLRIP